MAKCSPDFFSFDRDFVTFEQNLRKKLVVCGGFSLQFRPFNVLLHYYMLVAGRERCCEASAIARYDETTSLPMAGYCFFTRYGFVRLDGDAWVQFVFA